MVRGDYQIGTVWMAGGYEYEIIGARGIEVLLRYRNGEDFWWTITPSRTHKVLYSHDDGPYANIIRKIKDIKRRRESLGYVY